MMLILLMLVLIRLFQLTASQYSLLILSVIPNPESQLLNRECRIPRLEARVPNPGARKPNAESRSQPPETRIPNNESRVPEPDFRIPNPDNAQDQCRIPTAEPKEPSLTKCFWKNQWPLAFVCDLVSQVFRCSYDIFLKSHPEVIQNWCTVGVCLM